MDIAITDVRNQLAEVLNRVAYGGERAILKRRGKGVAAIISMADLALLKAVEEAEDAKAVRRALKEKGSVRWEKAKADLGL